ncbi:MAG: glycosyltransferase [Patescibacteria group bacterium]
MKIFVVGTIDNRGGAAGVSWELRKRLKADGHEVTTFVRYKYSNEPDVFAIPRKRYQDWLVKLFANDLMFAGTDYLLGTKEFKEADIIHCHNLHSNFFDLRTLQKMSLEKPVVWTLHDIWAFTGFASDSFTLKNPNKKKFLLFLWDNTEHLLRIKKKIYEKSKLYIVTVSEWLKKEVLKSILGKQSVTRIYNGIDTEIFKPYDKILARKELGLPLDKKIVALGIKGSEDSNKIIDDYVGNNDIFFIEIGHSHIKTENKNFRNFPYTEEKKLLRQYLSAADVFFYPTKGDTFGLISAEALSCGTPVVTYSTDALPEIVLHKIVGYVAEYGNIESAKTGIEYILHLSKADYELMSKKARERIVNNFSSKKMYEEYLALYKKILEKEN